MQNYANMGKAMQINAARVSLRSVSVELLISFLYAPMFAYGERRMVPKEGVEPSRPCGHTHLKRARLPFRHFGQKP